jgi:hypothetical protein
MTEVFDEQEETSDMSAVAIDTETSNSSQIALPYQLADYAEENHDPNEWEQDSAVDEALEAIADPAHRLLIRSTVDEFRNSIEKIETSLTKLVGADGASLRQQSPIHGAVNSKGSALMRQKSLQSENDPELLVEDIDHEIHHLSYILGHAKRSRILMI